jgi:hypothetical protein
MDIIESIKERVLTDGIEITNEVIKPVAEKWDDGLIHETDNLQITFKSVSDHNLEEVMAYLYYFDLDGNELGHEFDIPEDKIRPGIEAHVSLLLTPPENYAYTKLEFKAEQEHKENHVINFVIMSAIVLVVYLIDKFW